LYALTYFPYRLPVGRKGMMSVRSWAVAVWISSKQAQRPLPLVGWRTQAQRPLPLVGWLCLNLGMVAHLR